MQHTWYTVRRKHAFCRYFSVPCLTLLGFRRVGVIFPVMLISSLVRPGLEYMHIGNFSPQQKVLPARKLIPLPCFCVLHHTTVDRLCARTILGSLVECVRYLRCTCCGCLPYYTMVEYVFGR